MLGLLELMVADRTTFSIVWRRVGSSSMTWRMSRVARAVKPVKLEACVRFNSILTPPS